MDNDKVCLRTLILCTMTRRGKGVKQSPIRIITEVFDTEGNLLAENDPFAITVENMLEFLCYKYSSIPPEKHEENIVSYFLENDN